MPRPKQNQPATAAAPATPKKKLSLGEFRAWLSGVEEMQEQGWSPNATQWRTIRQKIEEVIDAPAPRGRFEDGGNDDEPRVIRPAGPSAFTAGPAMAPPPTALTVESSSLVAAPNEVPAAGGVHSGGLKVKTPNIDTSKTPYVAAFE